MSRGLSGIEATQSSLRNTIVIQLIEVLFDSGPLRLALGAHDVTSGGVTYTASRVVSIEANAESADSTEGLSFALDGLDAGILAIAAAEPYYRRPVNLYEQWLYGDYAGGAYVAAAAPRLEWCGVLTGLVIEEQDRRCSIAGTAEHYDADLRRPRTQRYNNADQTRRYPTDTGFSMAEQLTQLTLVWPSKEALKK